MFKCESCQQSPFHIDADGRRVSGRPNRVVVERKMVDHLKGTGAGPRGGVGSQIVREVSICDACAGKIAEAPIERAELVKKQITPGITFEGAPLKDIV